ncbi:hypothetical protein ZeamMp037 (mitochondrion) [Zea mays subsp. mays]|jgi:hypothetical protein|uniref:Uncharacterized protein orf116-b n=1 Tax=Zea mays TaxID=4577 RepID=Q6R9K9_MAIZE|nr:hypothetical protein ZeamMp037 [Zea mays subsp. mays]AAR91133.1 hypothetical protein [Zea mays]WEB51423.1 hypothetical protein [Zea mays]WEB51585.1 hypothetical protein [Zea mays]|eukprot:YP_588299.1 hypothetical protein ZeamMp037 (mitochondrion) [Zea mays subsp. mays]
MPVTDELDAPAVVPVPKGKKKGKSRLSTMPEPKGKAVPIRFKASVLASLSSTSEPISSIQKLSSARPCAYASLCSLVSGLLLDLDGLRSSSLVIPNVARVFHAYKVLLKRIFFPSV